MTLIAIALAVFVLIIAGLFAFGFASRHPGVLVILFILLAMGVFTIARAPA